MVYSPSYCQTPARGGGGGIDDGFWVRNNIRIFSKSGKLLGQGRRKRF